MTRLDASSVLVSILCVPCIMEALLSSGLRELARPDFEEVNRSIAAQGTNAAADVKQISMTRQGRGFTNMRLSSRSRSGRNKASDFPNLVVLWERSVDLLFGSLPGYSASSYADTIEALRLVGRIALLEGEEGSGDQLSVSFRDNTGQCHAMVVGFMTPSGDSTARVWWLNWFSIEFELMPDIVITRRTRRGAHQDTIHYASRGVNSADCLELLQVCCSIHTDFSTAPALLG
jgi:hypothetical protein